MFRGPFEIEPFKAAEGSLASEHAAVSRWVEDAFASLGRHNWYRDVDLKSLPSGKALLDADAEQAKRLVMAAIAQVRYWGEQVQHRRSGGTDDRENDLRGRGRQAQAVVAALTRRSLPFDAQDIRAMLEWCNASPGVTNYDIPIGNITRAVERYAAHHGLEPGLVDVLNQLATRLRQSYGKDSKRYATAIEQLCAPPDGIAAEAAEEIAPANPRPVHPAPAGNAAVLPALKEYVGVAAPEAASVESRAIGLDQFPLRSDSPLAAEHELLGEVFPEVIGKVGYNHPDLGQTRTGKRILALDDAGRGRVLLAAAERDAAGLLGGPDLSDHRIWQSRSAAAGLVREIADLPFALDRAGAFDFLLFLGARTSAYGRARHEAAMSRLLDQVEATAESEPLTEGERYVLHLLRASLIGGPPLGTMPPEVARLTKLIGDGATFYLVPGEAWSDQLNIDIAAASKDRRAGWTALLKQLLTATGSRPTGKWLKQAVKLSAAIEEELLTQSLSRWFPLVSKGRSITRTGASAYDARTGADVMHEENATALRGLLWLAPALKRKADLVRDVAAVAMSAYRKVPGVGPRAVKVGNAAVYALSEIATPQAVGQLAMLKVRVKFGTAQKEIEKAFNASAAALGMPREQIEEMGVPSYGLEEVGLRREKFGEEITCELRVDGREVNLVWLRADGKPQKSIPANVKANHKEELKELQGAAKDIAAMLPAQAERIDQAFLQQKRWDVAAWRERYLDHPLVGTIARRLIWTFTNGADVRSGIWHDGRIVNVDDEPIDLPPEAQVELWHPIGRPMDDVLAWRGWLERHEVRQPFKQAHREVYLLTDAERRTATYSNRFAAHILRQHQFNALCAARGWRNKLRLMVDDSYPPATRELPNWGLRAEFWIEGIGDNYGQDTNDSGTYLRVATDQVRFYRTVAAANYAHAGGGGYASQAAGPGTGNVNEPIPLDQIPPLVFSEILRDVDLFVGVGSVGNDPTWQDGGPEGRYRTYWHTYSFGELSETANTRKAVLERLLPRLTKIRDRCTLSERFLVVRGDLRTYKIHLGSGNILMEPNDQYLCIVPSRSTPDGAGDVFLPFEGDATLSIILSKAFLLAEDRKIKDETITRQIAR
jgi:hypothetical protein